MANRLNYNDLLKYMEIVLDMEKNVYVELKSWQDLQGKIKRVGIAKNYEEPQNFGEGITDFGCAGIFMTLFFSIFFGGIVYFLLRVIGAALWIFTLHQHDITQTVCWIIGGIVAGLITVISIGSSIKQQNANRRIYRSEMNEYNRNLKNDNARVQRELAQKQYLQTQADTLGTMWRTSKKKLDKMYSYDILEEKYRNIVAVASIYEYLKHERTRSLQRVGSDEGAYNIFESEVRLNKIITNTDIIIQKLDVVIENQRELANTMRNAQNSINHLVTSTNNMSARLQSGMKQLNASAELSNYQQQQTNNELRYMNFMNTLHFYS